MKQQVSNVGMYALQHEGFGQGQYFQGIAWIDNWMDDLKDKKFQ